MVSYRCDAKPKQQRTLHLANLAYTRSCYTKLCYLLDYTLWKPGTGASTDATDKRQALTEPQLAPKLSFAIRCSVLP